MARVVARTERLTLRTWRPDDPRDRAAGLRIWGDPEVVRELGESPLDAAGVERCLRAGRAHYEEHGVQHFAVERRDTGEVIGACGFHRGEDPDVDGSCLELVYHFARDVWGLGFATEAARACVELARREHAPVTLVAAFAPGHDASRRVLEKLGFRSHTERWFEDTQRHEPVWHLSLP